MAFSIVFVILVCYCENVEYSQEVTVNMHEVKLDFSRLSSPKIHTFAFSSRF